MWFRKLCTLPKALFSSRIIFFFTLKHYLKLVKDLYRLRDYYYNEYSNLLGEKVEKQRREIRERDSLRRTQQEKEEEEKVGSLNDRRIFFFLFSIVFHIFHISFCNMEQYIEYRKTFIKHFAKDQFSL